MKKFIFSIICFFYIFFTTGAFAQFYQWKDKNGVKHFTDNLLEVPKDQRPNLKIHEGINDSEKKKDTQTNNEPPPEITLESEKTELDTEKTELDSERITLESERIELDKAYKAIQEKRKTVLAQRKSITQEKYNELVNQLNVEITALEQNHTAYETKVEAYNNKINDTDKN